MQDYWREICDEVSSETEDARQQSFVKLAELTVPQVEHGQRALMRRMPGRQYRYHVSAVKRKPRGVVVYLGERYPQVYLTCRECHCALLLLKGYTLKAMAQHLCLSRRTVEYYLVNVKMKLKCRSRATLIRILLDSDFLQNLSYIASHAKSVSH